MLVEHRWRRTISLLLVLGMAGVIAGASLAAGSTAAAKTQLIVLEDDIAPGLDVDGTNTSHPGLQETLLNIMEPLVAYPRKDNGKGVLVPNYKVGPLQYEPRLATSWMKKGLVWTFKLRPGVKSCAGNTFTADDVVYTFQRAMSVSGGSPTAWFLGNVAGVLPLAPVLPKATAADKTLKGEVTKIDASTVQFKQLFPNELFPRMLEVFGLYIFDSKEMKRHATASDPWSHLYANTVNSPGFGAYCLSKWNKGSEIDLTANPGYYMAKPQFTSVIIRKVAANSNRVAAIQSGAADVVTNLTPQEFSNVAKNKSVSVLGWSNNKVLFMGIHYGFAPWNAKTTRLIRQAIAFAMPYNDIIKSDLLGKARVWQGQCESTYYGFAAFPYYTTNSVKAKALLAQAGYPGGKGLPTAGLTLYYPAERRALLEPVANRIRTALGQIGINISLAPISLAEFTDRTITKHDAPMFLDDFDRPLGPDVGYCALLEFVSGKNGGLVQFDGYDNPAFDALYLKSAKTTGATRLAALKQMQQILMRDLPQIPIAEVYSELAVRKGITGWAGSTYDVLAFRYFKSA